jgi:formyltetrahydrofolate-dependent phosphoribosylglycinamide formyltransferase
MTTRLAVLLSGGGTTFQNFLDKIASGELDAGVEVVLSSRADARGLERARAAGIPTEIVESRKYKRDWPRFSDEVTARLDRYDFDLITLAGFMCFYVIPDKYLGRVMNIHPALIPAFCGEGLYGHRVHEAAIERGVKVSGCTVHFSDNLYDHGPIIVQRTVPVTADDTPDTIAERVFREECIAYPEAIRLFGEGRLRIEGSRVRILDAPARD